MEETAWDSYGTGNYEKCANCMVHCGYEGTAVADTVANPLKALKVTLKGVGTEGEMAPETDLSKQRLAVYAFEDLVVETVKQKPAKEACGRSPAKPAEEHVLHRGRATQGGEAEVASERKPGRPRKTDGVLTQS